MKLTRILHHSVNVEGGLAGAEDFYRQLLALGDLPRPEVPGIDGHWFSIGDAQVHLVDAPAGPGPIRPEPTRPPSPRDQVTRSRCQQAQVKLACSTCPQPSLTS